MSARARARTTAIVALACAPLLAGARHPLHTTLTALSHDARAGTVTAVVRAFAEDFAPAAARAARVRAGPGHAVSDSAAAEYLRARLRVHARGGRALRFAWCGARREGDVLWLCLRASAPEGLAGATVHAAQLFEVFEDQVNVVQASYGGARRSVLFARGEAPKRLP